MKSLNSDALVLAVSAVLIGTFSFLLYLDFTARIEAGDAEQIGIITYKKRLSQRKYGTQVIWEEIEQNAPVYVNDSIRTADRSEAVVKLNDGTSIELDENSMIVLAKSEGSININFSHGAIMARRSDIATKEAPAVNIVAGAATVSVEKSDVKLSQTEKEDLNLTVAKGSAVIKSGDEEKIVSVNQNAILRKDEKTVQVRDVKLRLILPEPNKYFVTSQKMHDVQFSWDIATGDEIDTFFELSPNRNFKTIVKRIMVTKDAVREKVPVGEYYWRLVAIDKVSKRHDYSEVRKISVINDQPIELISPDNLAKFYFISNAPLVRFRWSKNELASKYVIEIARDIEFKSKIFSFSTSLNEHVMDSLSEGIYFWRVYSMSEFVDNEVGKSTVRKFIIERRKVVNPPELVRPVPNAMISSLEAKQNGILLSWKLIEGINTYEVCISKIQDFSKLEVRHVANGNFIRIKQDFAAGEYFWKVKPLVSADTELASDIEPRRFTVVDATIKLISPKNNFAVKAMTEKSEILFNWSKAPFEGKYVVELSKSPTFKNIERRELTEKSSLTMEVFPSKYYWRVALVDSDNQEIGKSDVFSFSVTEPEKISQKATLVVDPLPSSASIFVNGTKVGDGKVEVSVEMGKVNLEVIAEGYKKFEKSFEVAAGQKQEIKVVLEKVPQKSLLAVRVIPERSAVLINDKLIGYGTVKAELDPGIAKITVQSPGYKKYETSLVLKEGEKRDLVVELELIQKEIPKIAVPKEPIVTPPLVSGNTIIAATATGVVKAAEKSGAPLWQVKLSGKVESTPLTDENSIYLATTKGELVALDSKTGKLLWKQNIDGPVLFSGKPVRIDGKIVVATSFGSIEMYTTQGELIWKKKLESGVFNSPAYYDGMIYVGAADRNVYALSEYDGRIIWKYKTDSRMVVSSPLLHRNLVFVGCYSGSFYALGAKDGKLKWKYDTKSPIVTNSVVWEDRILIAPMNGEMVVLNSDNGRLVWNFDIKGKIVHDPVYHNGNLYIVSNKTFHVFDVRGGNERWRVELESAIKTPPSVAGDEVLVALKDGTLVSINPTRRKKNVIR